MKTHIFAFAILFFVLVGCRPKQASMPQPRTDRYSVDSLKRVARSDFAAAFHIIGEGESQGDLSPAEADRLRANLIYQFDDDYQQAIRYCKRALASLDDDEIGQRVKTLYALASIAYTDKDLSTCLQACSEGKLLTHRYKLPFQEYSFDYLVGECQFVQHREEDGLKLMRESLEKARRVAKSQSDYGHLIYFENNLISAYSQIEDVGKVLDMLDVFEASVDEMETLFPDDKMYYDRCRYNLFSGRAEAKALLGKPQEAETDFRKALALEYARTRPGQIHQLSYYAAVGQVDSVLAINERCPYPEADTIRRNYCKRLSRIEEAYRVAGDTLMADCYLHRIEEITRLIELREMEEGVAVNAAQYDTQHFQLALNDVKQTAKRTRILVYQLVAAIVVTLLVLLHLNKRKLTKTANDMQEKAKIMENEMERLQKQVRVIANEHSGAQADKQSAKSLESFVEGQQLYLKKDISRALVANLMGCSQQTMTKMLNEIQPDLSFPDYIKSLRVNHALNLIKENSNLTVQQVADQSGFYSISSFERSFKAVTGKTPRAYMKEVD